MPAFIILRPNKVKVSIFVTSLVFLSLAPIIELPRAPGGLTRLPPVAVFLFMVIDRVDTNVGSTMGAALLYAALLFFGAFVLYYISCILGEVITLFLKKGGPAA